LPPIQQNDFESVRDKNSRHQRQQHQQLQLQQQQQQQKREETSRRANFEENMDKRASNNAKYLASKPAVDALDKIDILYWMKAPRIGALGGGFK